MKKIPLVIPLLLVLLFSCSSAEEWELAWADEFDSPGAPGAENWAYETGKIRNREIQYYTDETKNVRVADGVLVIEALRENGDSVTSASVHTRGRKEFLYGRIEVRAKIPSARGTWPAIWMLGTNIGEAGWPACGEIDIMENVGHDPETIHANIHTEAYNHVKGTNKGNHLEVKEPWAEFHIYAVDWFDDHMDFFLDDSLYFTFQNDGAGDPATWPFNQPHYLLINLAFGGSWGGQEGVDFDALPLRYEIDYVRYYQKP